MGVEMDELGASDVLCSLLSQLVGRRLTLPRQHLRELLSDIIFIQATGLWFIFHPLLTSRIFSGSGRPAARILQPRRTPSRTTRSAESPFPMVSSALRLAPTTSTRAQGREF